MSYDKLMILFLHLHIKTVLNKYSIKDKIIVIKFY